MKNILPAEAWGWQFSSSQQPHHSYQWFYQSFLMLAVQLQSPHDGSMTADPGIWQTDISQRLTP